jgi:two-component system response regulator HydG
VRELRNVVERAAIFGESEAVGLDDLPPAVRAAAGDAPGPAPAKPPGDVFPTLREVEREHCRAALVRSGWNKAAAARLLGIDRVTLYAKIERLGLEA